MITIEVNPQIVLEIVKINIMASRCYGLSFYPGFLQNRVNQNRVIGVVWISINESKVDNLTSVMREEMSAEFQDQYCSQHE